MYSIGQIVSHPQNGKMELIKELSSGSWLAKGLDGEWIIDDLSVLTILETPSPKKVFSAKYKNKKQRAREIIRQYVGKQEFVDFVEYLQSTWYRLTVETSEPEIFEDEYHQRLNKDTTLPEASIQRNKWGTQIRVHFLIPPDTSLIPFQEAISGEGGSFSSGKESWINLGNGNGEITNKTFNWELRENGILFDFEEQRTYAS